RTAVVMGKYPDIIDMAYIQLAFDAVDDRLGLSVYTTHRGNDPQFIANTGIAIITLVTFKSKAACRDFQLCIYRVIAILQVIVQVGFYIVRMHMLARLNTRQGMANRITVFNHI